MKTRTLVRANYADLNDLPRDVIRKIAKPGGRRPENDIVDWNLNEQFPIEIIREEGAYHVWVHYVNSDIIHDKLMRKSEIIIKVSPPAVNGPQSTSDFYSILIHSITQQLKTSNTTPSMKEIRIETTEEVITQVLEGFNRPGQRRGMLAVNQLKPLLGDDFNVREINAFGDYCIISGGVISYSVAKTRPEKLFRFVNSHPIEHHLMKNNGLVFSFAAENVSRHAENSPEL